MNRTVQASRKHLLCLYAMFLSVLLFSFSNAQITIPQSGFSNLLTAGYSFYYYQSDSNLSPVNIGKRGGPSVYDFNGLTYRSTGLSHVYSVGAIPAIAARFPAKSITIGDTPETIENNPVFLFSNDTLYVLGEASLVPLKRFRHNRPYEPMAVFPVTYQTVRTYTHMHYDTTYNTNGTLANTNAFSGSDSVTVDGFGTLKVLGRQFECLRVKLNHYTFSDKEFMFYTREGVFMNIQMLSSQKDTGTVQPTSIMLLVPSSIVKVGRSDLTPSACTLEQNYPNPFNPSTAISFQLPALSVVELRVFDLLGKEVTTLISGLRQAGAHKVYWNGNDARGESMPSGVYVYRLTVGSSVVAMKMILLR